MAAGVPAPAGRQLWVSSYVGPGLTEASAIATSPSGSTVYVTAYSSDGTNPGHYATLAYSATTGAQLWLSRYKGPGHGFNSPAAIAVSPDGSRVFVTGSSEGSGTSYDYATIAYNAATGATLWVSRYNDPQNEADQATALALSPDGQTVFVTGSSGSLRHEDYATIAYSAATGAELWIRRYNNGPGGSYDSPNANAVAASPDGRTVVVTGYSFGKGTAQDFATVAYSATSGRTLWVRRYSGPAKDDDEAQSIAFGPTSGSVYVTGFSLAPGVAQHCKYVTIAYGAASGRTRWIRRYSGPRDVDSFPQSLAVDPSGLEVFVTGWTWAGSARGDYATIAYSTATGGTLWVRRYNGPANRDDLAAKVAVSPGGRRVYVTGRSVGLKFHFAYATVAYGALSGHQIWVQRYNGAANGGAAANAMTVGPHGTVYVSGAWTTPSFDTAATTIAYRG